jgi:hypothetical protein
MFNGNLSWGRSSEAQGLFVPLWWRSASVEKAAQIDDVVRDVTRPGVYAFEGRHDAHSNRSVLYIGSSQTLSQRIPQSFLTLSYQSSNDRWYFSDCWDVKVLYAEVVEEQQELIPHIERLLIVAHAPPFNNHAVRSPYEGPQNLIVMNCGEKRHLLPTLVADYYQKNGWPEPPSDRP